MERKSTFLIKGILLALIFTAAVIFFYYRANATEQSAAGTEFTVEIDGQKMDLYYDKDDVIFTNPDCTDPFLAPSGYPYTYANLDGTVVLVDNLWLDK